jgi:hypothetical protein
MHDPGLRSSLYINVTNSPSVVIDDDALADSERLVLPLHVLTRPSAAAVRVHFERALQAEQNQVWN